MLSSKKRSTKAKVIFASILTASFAFVANAEKIVVTNTIDGVTCLPASDLKWKVLIDTDKGRADLGLNSNGSDGGSWQANNAFPLDNPEIVVIPTNFIYNGETYKVDRLNDRAFLAEPLLRSVVIPETVSELRQYSLFCEKIENVLVRGPQSKEAGKTQVYSEISFTTNEVFRNSQLLDMVVFGPNIKLTGEKWKVSAGYKAKNATFFVPYRPDNTTWAEVTDESIRWPNSSGYSCKVVRYGPDYDFDMTMGETAMTFYPKNVNGLTNILALASTFKSSFYMDTKIVITNRIEMSEGVTITESMLQNVTLDTPPWYLTFAVKNQAQLNNILAAVSVDTPIIIDIEKSEEDIVVPDGRQVAILAKGGWKFGIKHKGLVVSLR